MKNVEKKMDEKKLNSMELLRELKRSKREVERLERENKLLRQKTEGVLFSPVWEAGTFLRYVERVLKVLDLQYVGLWMSVTQTFVARDGKDTTMEKVGKSMQSCFKIKWGCRLWRRSWCSMLGVTTVLER